MENFLEINNDNSKMLLMNGDLRKLQVDANEVIQRIYFSVRDEAWVNVPYEIKNFTKEVLADSVSYSYEMFFKNSEIHFNTSVKIFISADKIIIESDGKSLSNFKKNRIGFCVHLPATVKGKECTVTHINNVIEKSSFPVFISPHQPFKNIKSVEWININQKIKIEFEGDIFEMEDQRNWTDASYKIYSTPLENPFPVAVKSGEKFSQKVTVYFEKVNSDNDNDNHVNVYNTLHDIPVSPPEIGIFEPPGFYESIELPVNGAMPFSHYRVDFRLYKNNWKEYCLKSIDRAILFKLPIYSVIYFDKDFLHQANEFVNYISTLKAVHIHTICLLSSESFVLSDEVLEKLYKFFRQRFTNVLIGAGTDANFAQLNRNRPGYNYLDFLCYAIQPQEHASDVLSITENIQAQKDTVTTAKNFSNDKSIHITALSVFKRFNANINFIAEHETTDYEYKGSSFEAAWMLASMSELVIAGVSSINIVYSLQQTWPLMKFFRYLAKNQPEFYYNTYSLSPEEYTLLSWKCGSVRHCVFANLTSCKINVMHPLAKITLEPFDFYYSASQLNDFEK